MSSPFLLRGMTDKKYSLYHPNDVIAADFICLLDVLPVKSITLVSSFMINCFAVLP